MVVNRGSKLYRVTWFSGKAYSVHRLMWMAAHGVLPRGEIDHIDGNGLNNAIANLRDVDHSTNLLNQKGPRADNTTGYLGVSWHKHKKKFQATIKKNGVQRHLGYFNSGLEAHQTYLCEKEIINGHR